ncbi:Adenylate isopentenyltransferase [Musa troglodytarum]|uniref:Adenylate isopentenyltransferase n=1 Tax=Musa troglodytarum TaxID=320322 RepID=A0A9E7H8R0_9LILI|nr:Adenylate isopentenyltransferase [Musa troglodytarum]
MCRRCYSSEDYCVEDNDDGRKESVVVVVGATGTGKSKLSIDLATEFSGEVVNSDKIQVYRGLDITTNKMPVADRCGVPHHLLGDLDPVAGELPPAAFREMVAGAISGIAGRGRLPVVAGGSNSFIYADVEAATLAEQLDRRVEEMVAGGMVEELGRYFEADEEAGKLRHQGLAKAIGLAEFQEYFLGEGRGTAPAYEAAVVAIKANTRRLAEEQVWKIERLEQMGWPLRRLDATAVVAARLAREAAEAEAAWERDVAGPGAAAVEQFLKEKSEGHPHHHIVPSLIYN